MAITKFITLENLRAFKSGITTAYTAADTELQSSIINTTVNQLSIMPEASAANVGKVVQYVGSDVNYEFGFFYKCVDAGSGNYAWEAIPVQTGSGDSYNETIIAARYDAESAGYTAGEYCIYEHNLYVCKGATSGAWDSTKWDQVSVGDALESKQDVIDGSNKLSAAYVSGLASVATSGSYTDLSDTPTLGTAAAKDATSTLADGSTDLIESGAVYTALAGKQDTITDGSATIASKSGEVVTIKAGVAQSGGAISNDSGSDIVLGTAAVKDYTTSVTENSGDLITSGAVYAAIEALPEPMVFKGSVGTGGTIEWANFPVAAAGNEGYTYKVITAHTNTGASDPAPTCGVGDTLISTGAEWVVIPSGDEPSGTVTSIGAEGATGSHIEVSGSPITASGTFTFDIEDGYSIPSNTDQATWTAKQDALVSGTNIKTVNGQSILGAGDLDTNGVIAAEFDATKAYSEGDYVIYNHELYQAAANMVAGAWRSAAWTKVTVGGELERVQPNLADGDFIKTLYINTDFGTDSLNNQLAALSYSESFNGITCAALLVAGNVVANNGNYPDAQGTASPILVAVNLGLLGAGLASTGAPAYAGLNSCVGYGIALLAYGGAPKLLYATAGTGVAWPEANTRLAEIFNVGITTEGFVAPEVDIIDLYFSTYPSFILDNTKPAGFHIYKVTEAFKNVTVPGWTYPDGHILSSEDYLFYKVAYTLASGEDFVTDAEINRLFTASYSITGNITGGALCGTSEIYSGDTITLYLNPTTDASTGTINRFPVAAETPYVPVVTGATLVSYNDGQNSETVGAAGAIVITNPTGNVTITATCPSAM